MPAVNDNILDPGTAEVLLVNVKPADTVAMYTDGTRKIRIPADPFPP